MAPCHLVFIDDYLITLHSFESYCLFFHTCDVLHVKCKFSVQKENVSVDRKGVIGWSVPVPVVVTIFE